MSPEKSYETILFIYPSNCTENHPKTKEENQKRNVVFFRNERENTEEKNNESVKSLDATKVTKEIKF